MASLSNTPRWESDRCPGCRTDLRTYGFELMGEARCPRCDIALWHITLHSDTALFIDFAGDPGIKSRILDFLAERLEVARQELESNPELLRGLSDDSLEIVELVVQIDEATDTDGTG